jgi:nitrogen regulatory protein PII-like uncharacterized protein
MKISEQSHLSIYKIEPGTGPKIPASKSPDNLPFAPGQLIKGTVAGFTGDGKVLLDVGGQTVTARTLVPLTLGSELWLETGKGGSFPLLTLAAKKGAVQDFLKLLISGAPLPSSNEKGLSGLLLSSLLPGLAPDATVGGQIMTGSVIAATSGGESFPEAIKILTLLLGGSSGPQMEISQLLDTIDQKESTLKPALQPAAEKLVKILAAHQEINSQPPQTTDRNFLLFPCFFAGNAGWGEWIFSMEKEADPARGEVYSLSFFLEMSRLGPLALQATIANRTITGQILLESEKAKSHVEDNVQELAHILEKQGYHPVSFTCRVNKENIVSQLKEALEEKAAIRRFSILDVSV